MNAKDFNLDLVQDACNEAAMQAKLYGYFLSILKSRAVST